MLRQLHLPYYTRLALLAPLGATACSSGSRSTLTGLEDEDQPQLRPFILILSTPSLWFRQTVLNSGAQLPGSLTLHWVPRQVLHLSVVGGPSCETLTTTVLVSKGYGEDGASLGVSGLRTDDWHVAHPV